MRFKSRKKAKKNKKNKKNKNKNKKKKRKKKKGDSSTRNGLLCLREERGHVVAEPGAVVRGVGGTWE
jgi:hypothetical protein